MKIGFVARGLTKGGVRRSVENILYEFDREKKHEFYLFTDEKKFADKYSSLQVCYIPKRNKLIWDYIISPLRMRRYSLDFIFYSKNIIPFTHVLLKAKKVNIIHDLAHFIPGLKAYRLASQVYMKSFMKLSCQVADRVIAISESTKKDIIRFLNIHSSKIEVVHGGVESEFKRITDQDVLEKIKSKYNLHKPFIFYCGSISPRKNLLRVLQAFNRMKNEVPHEFYISTTKSWNDQDVRRYAKKHLNKRVVILPYLSKQELIAMYSLADLYVYVSLYEGFGLPILEAQACGCPVLTSKTTACVEIAGEGAYLVDPESVEEIAQGIKSITSEQKLRSKLVHKGLENVKNYSWEKTVRGLLSVVSQTNIK